MAKKKIKPKKAEPGEKYIWCVAYIHRKFLEVAEKELSQYGYEDIQTYIPTVRIISKKFKGKNVFEFVPLLFNYGFFKISYSNACNPEYLMQLRNRIQCIYGWVKDPAHNIKQNLRRDNCDSIDAYPSSAFASDSEVSAMIQAADSVNIYSAQELERFKKGDYIILKGYPFDDVHAKILHINFKKKEIRVEMEIASFLKEVTVSFENVFYTVYQGHDDSLSNDLNIDEMESHKNSSVDKFMFKTQFHEQEE